MTFQDRHIPWLIVAFFAVFIIVDAVFVTIAVKTNTGLVTERAYEKGLAYNETLEAARANDALGWDAKITLENERVILVLSDKNKKPLMGANVSVDFIRPTMQGHDFSLTLSETTPGRYETPASFPLPGQWRAHLHIEAQDAHFQDSQILMVP